MTPPNLHPIVKTILRVTASSALFLAVECLIDCSGLDKLADYYEFLEQQQQTLVHSNTENQIAESIGKLFVPTQVLQMV
jgi:hypothetical protein